MTEPSAPSEPPQFTRAEVEDAAREFGDAADALRWAGHRTWLVCLRAFVHGVRETPVVVETVRPLRAHTFDLEAWFKARTTGIEWHLHQGAQPLELPPEPEGAAALMLQLVEALSDEGAQPEQAVIGLVGLGADYDTRVRRAAGELLGPLVPYVERRLRELHRAAPPPPMPGAGIVIGHVTNLGALFGAHANVSASNFAAGSAGPVHQTTHAPRSELARELAGWTDYLGEVETSRRAEVRAALDALTRAADDGGARPSALAAAAETVVEAAPSFRARVGALVGRIGGAAGKIGKAAALGAATKAGEAGVEHHAEVVHALKAAWEFAIG